MHLMALTLIVTAALQGRIQVRWRRLATACGIAAVCLSVACAVGRRRLVSSTLPYDLDSRLLSLELSSLYDNVVVYRVASDVPDRPSLEGSTLDRVKAGQPLRVGYHPDHLPYSFFNQQQRLVGLDVELMHRLATRLQTRLEFVPYDYDAVVDQLNAGQIDVAVGGLIMKPERLLIAAFTQPYQTATVAIVAPDHRRAQFDAWDGADLPANLRLGALHEDVVAAARRRMPKVEIKQIDSISSFFQGAHPDLDGLLIPAEEGAVWNVLYPEHTVIVPEPVLRRPIGMAVRSGDVEWLSFLDRWLDFERLEGSLDRLHAYWVQGGGTQERPPRWSVLRDVLNWLP